jgi:preprotein translocase subunit YajC
MRADATGRALERWEFRGAAVYSLLITLATWFQPEASSGSAPTPTSAPKGLGGAGGMDLSSIGMMVLMMVVFYLVLIRPQQKKQKEHDALLKALKKGQKVRTNGGVRGEIVDFKSEVGEEVVLQIADKVKINILRSSIAGVIDAQAEADKKG